VTHADLCDEDGAPLPCHDEPEPAEPVMSTCGYCGAEFVGTSNVNDCGACPLSDEDAAHYSRRFVSQAATDAHEENDIDARMEAAATELTDRATDDFIASRKRGGR
jgi:hypothetical protein